MFSRCQGQLECPNRQLAALPRFALSATGQVRRAGANRHIVLRRAPLSSLRPAVYASGVLAPETQDKCWPASFSCREHWSGERRESVCFGRGEQPDNPGRRFKGGMQLCLYQPGFMHECGSRKLRFDCSPFDSHLSTYCPLFGLRFSLPSGVGRRCSLKSSPSAINLAFYNAPSSDRN